MTSTIALRRTTAAAWRGALDTGWLHPSEQELPGVLLHVDQARCDPDPLTSLPVTAVIATAPDREPVLDPPDPADAAARAWAHLVSHRRRRARTEAPVEGGVVLRDERYPLSRDHNALLLLAPVPATVAAAEADRALAGLAHRQVFTATAATADGLRSAGWEVAELVVMAMDPAQRSRADHVRGASRARAEQVDGPVAAHLWRRSWRAAQPDMPDEVLRQLLAREPLEHTVARVHDLAVFAANLPVAGAQIRIDGATAALDTVLTLREHRGGGRARAAVDAALDLAVEAGCDLVVLEAVADDWPREWYARLGFAEVGRSWVATRC